LLYALEQGPTEKSIIQQCFQQKLPLPDKIRNAPELFLGLELFYLSFMDLSSCRGQGYGTEGPIGWLQISDYCYIHGIIGEQRDDLIYHIQRMDEAYLLFKTKKLKQQTQTSTKK
jgi:hypothetical protein